MNDWFICKMISKAFKYAFKEMKEYNVETQDDPNWNPVNDPVVGSGMHYD